MNLVELALRTTSQSVAWLRALRDTGPTTSQGVAEHRRSSRVAAHNRLRALTHLGLVEQDLEHRPCTWRLTPVGDALLAALDGESEWRPIVAPSGVPQGETVLLARPGYGDVCRHLSGRCWLSDEEGHAWAP